jgi:hypothetical protein
LVPCDISNLQKEKEKEKEKKRGEKGKWDRKRQQEFSIKDTISCIIESCVACQTRSGA